MTNLIDHAITLVDGPNFSGRSGTLVAAVDEANGDGKRGVYVGPEIYHCLSGVTTRVGDELDLHAQMSFASCDLAVLAHRLGLDALADSNPLLLSGGEQACLAIVCALAVSPTTLSIDCALEQLDEDHREMLLTWLLKSGASTQIACADNRASEWKSRTGVMVQIAKGMLLGQLLPQEPVSHIGPMKLAPRASVLRVAGLQFGYGSQRRLLNQASFQFEPGSAFRLIGENGVGKSSLAKLLSGVLKPESGEVQHGDTLIQPWYQPGRVVAYHFQNPDVQLFSTTVLEEIRAGMERGASEADVLPFATMFGLHKLLGEHPLDLPFVLRKRVALAAAFATPAPWLILDEPTLGQDDATAATLAALIREQVFVGRGVIFISHSASFARQIQHVDVRLIDGKLR